MRIVGVDPGGSGALALLTDSGRSLDVRDMPVFVVRRGAGKKRTLDALGLERILEEWKPFDYCFFERVGTRPNESPSASFNFGHITGGAAALLQTSGAQFRNPTPVQWRINMGLRKLGKDDSRALASSLWPAQAELFKRVRDDGRADAALIAEYGRRILAKEGVTETSDIFG